MPHRHSISYRPQHRSLLPLFTWLLVFAGVLLVLPHSSFAKKRHGHHLNINDLTIVIPKTCKFGTLLLYPKRYRLSISGNLLSFADPKTMRVAGTISLIPSPKKHFKRRGEQKLGATLNNKRGKLTLLIVTLNKRWSAMGRVLSKQELSALQKGPAKLEIKNNSHVKIAKTATPVSLSERQLIGTAIQRRLGPLVDCAHKGRKFRWKTDDPRLKSCGCPHLDRWRLPKVKKALRFHQILLKTRAGLSFTVTPKGKAENCRLWMGGLPPEDENNRGQINPPPQNK